MNKKSTLTPKISHIVISKGTEAPNSGKYNKHNELGSYLCRQCGEAIFSSDDKFTSYCGWPSFDDCLPNKIKKQLDDDDVRTEIICASCGAHFGHVFNDEHHTPKNIRYCVNSLALDFIPQCNIEQTAEAIFAGGCFWGIEHYFQQIPGVLKTEVGYTGGKLNSPTYQQICSGNTRHVEATRILYDPQQISYKALTQLFFEIHDPTQANGQGVDIGPQYKSIIFYLTPTQKKIANSLINDLTNLGYQVVTQILPATTFWPAEQEHQHYYKQHIDQIPCHCYTSRFPKENN